MIPSLRGALALLTAVIAVGAVYELAVAVGLIALGPQPGDAPAGSAQVVGLSVVALLLTGVLLLGATLSSPARAAWGTLAAPLAGAVAGAFLVARFYSYDPYYAPYPRRMSDGGLVAGRWVALVVVATLAAGILARRWPRAASAVTAVGVWTIALTAAVAGLGH